MTPEEHYREAERLVAVIVDSDGTPHGPQLPNGREHNQAFTDCTIALAQVHATLATKSSVSRELGLLAIEVEWLRRTFSDGDAEVRVRS